jgi:hypothetical protein
MGSFQILCDLIFNPKHPEPPEETVPGVSSVLYFLPLVFCRWDLWYI